MGPEVSGKGLVAIHFIRSRELSAIYSQAGTDSTLRKGWYVLRNGGVYDGEWKGGKLNGLGTFKRNDGMLFGGEFKDNIPQGRGRKKLADGSVQDFEFKDGNWQICQ